MGKSNHDNTLHRQRISRPLLAISLAASLAAYGCTTNLNPGNGTPTRSSEVRTAPTAGVTSGGETTTPPENPPLRSSYVGPEVLPNAPQPSMASSYSRSEALPPSMTSSYSRPEALPAVSQRSIRRSAAEAAAIMADNQPAGGRYLGVASPGTPGRGYQSDRISTFVPPALQTNPQLTLNASISSDPTSAINSVTAADGTGVTTGGTTAGVTVTGAADATPTTAATTVTPGSVAGTSTLPTFASANVPSVTAASAGLGRVTAGTTRTGTTTTATAGTTTAAATAGTAASGTARGALSPVRIQRGTNGAVTVTNIATPARTTGRSQ